MALPQLNTIALSRDWIDTFGGYNHNDRIGDQEFYDMKNMSSDAYPLLANRARRGEYPLPGESAGADPVQHVIQGMIEKDTLWYVDDDILYKNGQQIRMLSPLPEGKERQLVSMGAYIVIFPDNVFVNTINISDSGFLSSKRNVITGSVTFSHCNIDGTDVVIGAAQDEAPAEPSNLEYWIDTSGSKAVLKQYSSASSMWITVTTTYIKISIPDIGYSFKEGDAISISGINTGEQGLNDLNATSIIWHKDTDYIVVIGIMDSKNEVTQSVSAEQPITLERKIPDMDFVCESGNRLWGCKYGLTDDGQIVNEIYASKLGDFCNWKVLAGVSTDSYTASVGTDGPFTGCINFLGQPLFFKENWLHTVYGNLPSNFRINQTQLRGVEKGSHKSLAIVDEKLFYKSRVGVMVLSGSLPQSINAPLGQIAYTSAVGGGFGSKYYISMKDTGNTYHLFVYDTSKGIWHCEDNTQASGFCSVDDKLYMSTDGKIYEIINPTNANEEPVSWHVETGKIGLSSPDKKYLARMDIRLSLDLGTVIRIYVQYDSIPSWDAITTVTGTKLESFAIPIRPKRCDHMRLRIEGRGAAKIYSICKTMEQGSDRR